MLGMPLRLRPGLLVAVAALAPHMGAQLVLPKSALSPAKDPTQIEFVKIAPGEFVMGCSEGDAQCLNDEKPAHKIQITKAFEVGKYEVTQAQWQAVMGSNPSTIKGDDHPVETVSKNDVHDFLAKLNAKNDGYKYRLPTEAEWEFAARAGDSGEPQSLDDVAWYGANSGDTTHAVGTKKPNAWGLYDMLGNVREWVEDLYVANYYSNSPAADPTGPQPGQQGGRGGRPGFGRGNFQGGGNPQGGNPPGPNFQNFQGRGGRRGFGRGGGMRQLPIMRGGGWDNSADFIRYSSRYHYYGPTLRVSDIGFRVVRVPM